MSAGRVRSRLQSAAGAGPGSFAARMRQRRFELVRELLETVKKPYRMLDAGGTEGYWQTVGMCGESGVEIVLLNLEAVATTCEGMHSIVGSAVDLAEFADDEFDVVFSNSVIEHVGGIAEQRRMADEVRRVGRRYYVQTPNRYFPIEPHFLFPFFGVLPLGARAFLLRHFALGWGERVPDRAKSYEVANSARLLTRRELVALFPDGRLVRERVFGLTKSFSVYGGEW